MADTRGRLQVLALYRVRCRRHPGRLQAGRLRALQRRVHDWWVQYGPDREVVLRAGAVPDREAAFDFTLGASERIVPGRAVPARSPRQDDRLGEVVVVRVAGCRRGLRDAARVRFGDLPSRPTLLPRSLPGAMPAMRRRARRFTSFARTDTAVPRKQGGGRCSNAKGSGSAPYVHPTRADATESEPGVRAEVSEKEGENLEPASGLEPLTC